MKKRLDLILTEKKLAGSRTAAQRLIASGSVRVNGITAEKASELFDGETDSFEVSGDAEVLKYVGRGGFKLETAVEEFGIPLENKVCIDIGASTGGFTDCMLRYGAKRVYAVDVGTAQLAEKLRRDSRVISLEKLDIRNATDNDLPEKADFICIDVSFISLKLILPCALSFLKPSGSCTALIKPQFELGKKHIGKNGVAKDPKIHKSVTEDIRAFAEDLGCRVVGVTRSKIDGGDGNREFLMYFTYPGGTQK